MPLNTRRILLSWSSGKDSAWCLHVLRQDPSVQVVGLLTSFNEKANRVAMHAVRRELVELQARSVGLPLHTIELPWPCSNEEYEKRMRDSLDSLKANVEFDAVAFGDLFLEDIRVYREEKMHAWGVDPVFPIWNSPTNQLACQMVDSGLRAYLTCVDPRQCPAEFAGRLYDRALLEDLPDSVDPCGENGEFHSFVFDGPMFDSPIDVTVGQTVERGGFVFSDVVPIG